MLSQDERKTETLYLFPDVMAKEKYIFIVHFANCILWSLRFSLSRITYCLENVAELVDNPLHNAPVWVTPFVCWLVLFR